MAGRRKFTREFKLEAVKLVRDRGVTMAQAARDLDLNVNVLRTNLGCIWGANRSETPKRPPSRRPSVFLSNCPTTTYQK